MNSKVSNPEIFRTRQRNIEEGVAGWIRDELQVTPAEVRVTRLDNSNGALRIESQYRHPDTGRWRKLDTLYLVWTKANHQHSAAQ